MDELKFLREKDKVFNEADVQQQHLKDRIASLEIENERLNSANEENEFQLRVFKKEND